MQPVPGGPAHSVRLHRAGSPGAYVHPLVMETISQRKRKRSIPTPWIEIKRKHFVLFQMFLHRNKKLFYPKMFLLRTKNILFSRCTYIKHKRCINKSEHFDIVQKYYLSKQNL
jgi:hypothetical protein